MLPNFQGLPMLQHDVGCLPLTRRVSAIRAALLGGIPWKAAGRSLGRVVASLAHAPPKTSGNSTLSICCPKVMDQCLCAC